MYETMTYTGGVHKHYEIEELIEDLDGSHWIPPHRPAHGPNKKQHELKTLKML